ncbi:hypothetical protein DL96DRAFT_1559167 [Flagelloscypha sp. PMI_526]|nr:hypothetical protein DL96DRAFT_1559167 [Flagelloscypha sp. PMI_526]
MPFSADIPSSPLPIPTVERNRVPSLIELAQIRQSVTNSRTALADIKALRALLNTLEDTDALLMHTGNVKTHRRRLRDANILPPDVWREIFTWVVALSPPAPNRPLCSPQSPLTLSQVCRDWRHSVCRLSALWARIYVIDTLCPISVGTVGLLGLFLARSFPLPLDVCLHLSSSGSKTTEETQRAEQIIHMITSQSFRWQKAGISLPASVWRSITTFPIVSPVLEEVHLNCEDGPNLTASLWTQAIFTEQSAPKLESVHLQSFIPAPTSLQHFLPWPRLRHVTVRVPEDDVSHFGLLEGLGILQWCRDLESVDLDLFNLDPLQTQTPLLQPLICSNLRRLRVMSKGSIFEHFSAPHLCELAFWSTQESAEIVASFVKQSPHLTSLKVAGSNISIVSDLTLPVLESLTLTVTSCETLTELLDLLRNFSSDTYPLLKEVIVQLFMDRILRSQRSDQEALMLRFHGAIVNLANSAIHPTSRFRKIHVIFHEFTEFGDPDDINSSILQSLKDTQLEGLEVSYIGLRMVL